MKIYELKQEQHLNIKISEAWNFFSDPGNLNKITPPELKFEIITPKNEEMFSGQIIQYKIEILPKIKSTWVTEIKNVEKFRSFIDEQRFGPYKFWHHLHQFREVDSGVIMTDLVRYSMPFGLIGRLAHRFYVKNKLKQIFNYRFRLLEEKFNNVKINPQ